MNLLLLAVGRSQKHHRQLDTMPGAWFSDKRAPRNGPASSIAKALHLVGALIGLLFSSSTQAHPLENLTKYRLENGLEVILGEDHRTPSIALSLWYHAGPIAELPGQKGLAHLFEHLLFDGSKHITREQADEAIGSFGGFQNGATSLDWTAYFAVAPSSELPTLLWLQSDRMGFALEAMTQKAFDTEVAVVRNERRQAENTPYGGASLKLWDLLFPFPHPYQNGAIGSHRDLAAATRDDAVAFFKRFYGPNNATLVLSGDLQPKTTRELVQRYFGSLRPINFLPRVMPLSYSSRSTELRETLSLPANLPRITFAWLTGPAYSTGEAELNLLTAILSEKKASPLYHRLVDELELVREISCGYLGGSLGSIWYCDLVVNSAASLARVEKEFDALLAMIRDKGPTQADLDWAETVWESRMMRRLQSSIARAQLINEYNHYTGAPSYFEADLRRHRAASITSVRDVAKKWLNPAHKVVLTVLPLSP